MATTSRITRSDFVLSLSASVTGIKGIAGAHSSPGSIEGVKIDVGKLLEGKFPIIDIASIGVSVKGTIFGGELDAALIGGILKLDAGGRMIDPFDSITPVEDRVFFIGVEGGFTMHGMSAGCRSASRSLSSARCTVQLGISLPTGVMLFPPLGLI